MSKEPSNSSKITRYGIKLDLVLCVFQVSHVVFWGLFFKKFSFYVFLGFVFFYLVFLQPSPKYLIIAGHYKVCLVLLALSVVKCIYR